MYLWCREGLVVPKMLTEQPGHTKERRAKTETTKVETKGDCGGCKRARKENTSARNLRTQHTYAIKNATPAHATAVGNITALLTGTRQVQALLATCFGRHAVDDSLVHADGPLKLHVASRDALHLFRPDTDSRQSKRQNNQQQTARRTRKFPSCFDKLSSGKNGKGAVTARNKAASSSRGRTYANLHRTFTYGVDIKLHQRLATTRNSRQCSPYLRRP